jgi:DNA repair exonuclease SbcCD nuclease subunit
MGDCFVHASDLHLDLALGELGWIPEETAGSLEQSAKKAWQSLCDLTIDRKASFLVLAGDIYHEGAGLIPTQKRFHDGLERLAEKNIKVFIAHGNHDPLVGSPAWMPYPEGVKAFRINVPESFPVELRSGGSACVSGVSFSSRHEKKNLAKLFHGLQTPPGPHVAVLHTNLGRNTDHHPYAPCKKSDLEAADVDYWALGHIHLRSDPPIDLGPGRYAAYSGNNQGRTFKESECHPKGALVVPIDGSQVGVPEFVECDEVRFVQEVVRVDPEDSIGTVVGKILESAQTAGQSAGHRPVVWKLELTGRFTDSSALRTELYARDEDEYVLDDLPGFLNGGGLAELIFKVDDCWTDDELDGFTRMTLGQLAGSSVVPERLKELEDDLHTSVKSVVELDDAEVETIVRQAGELVRDKLGQPDA